MASWENNYASSESLKPTLVAYTTGFFGSGKGSFLRASAFTELTTGAIRPFWACSYLGVWAEGAGDSNLTTCFTDVMDSEKHHLTICFTDVMDSEKTPLYYRTHGVSEQPSGAEDFYSDRRKYSLWEIYFVYGRFLVAMEPIHLAWCIQLYDNSFEHLWYFWDQVWSLRLLIAHMCQRRQA